MSTEEQTPQTPDAQGGHVPFTPPPASTPPAVPVVEPAPRTPGAGAITIVTAIVGGIALLGAGATGAAAASSDLGSSDAVQSIDVSGITSLDMDVSAGDVRVEFGDVDEAELSVTGDRGRGWTLERDGDELVVRSPDHRFGWWFGEWFDNDQLAVLTLPSELQDAGFDASLTLNAGSLDVSGEFGELDLELAAGDLTVKGVAAALDAQVSAGGADIVLEDVSTAELGVSAGNLTVELTGTPPTETSVDVNAGELDLTVPDAEYHVTQDVSAGDLDNRLEESSDSRRTIEVSISAGTVTLRPGS
ncbi:DUF4097 family beta strand repeat-containing protein [Microbacterium sp. SD291]|uniref:DUF4097 family beta strand repeat-containing protein n=1 Tax=Microbacterium sp. SD291 TaxID=2782007 RepID=UPI001A960C9B|nr:DUF4097 family beta strand repeat-containing protein [Microbacterium sp. SD291]MBO0980312.1 DUF4097 family beta strand repeat protein [Microbacterium sp. SD291]